MDWDSYFISICKAVRIKSKDPSTQVGAVIIGPEKQIVATGFNGFPRGIDETDQTRWERPIKYEFIEHAERNAIYNAARHGIPLRGCTLYLVGLGPPTMPCIECAKAIIQSGITRVIGAALKEVPEPWLVNLAFAKSLLIEAGISVEEHTKGVA